MNVFKCDRCGVVFDPYFKSNNRLGAFCLENKYEAGFWIGDLTERYDLCPRCKESFDRWLQDDIINLCVPKSFTEKFTVCVSNDELREMFKNDKEVE